MRELNISDKKIRVRATPLALLYYKQAFKTDLLGDLIKLVDIEKDLSKLDTVALLQLIWAMAKADAFGSNFPSFEEWVGSLDTIDFSDPSFLKAALEEAADGFLCRGKQNKQNK
jgi:hypothetical protein